MIEVPPISADGLDAAIECAALDFDAPAAAGAFPLAGNRYLARFQAHKARDKRSRVGVKRLIRPENAAALAECLPERGDHTHAVVRGDFVMMDILPVLMAKAGNVLEVYASTLGMSVANAQALRSLADAGVWVHVVVSHYFAGVDRSTTFRQVRDILGPERVTVARSHCKVILVDGDAASFVVEGSANLRSSDCVEQFTVFNDDELLRWHRSWMEEIAHA